MSAIAVAIIGMGPRGMTVLERLVSMGRRFPRLPLTVHVIDPGVMGCGVHRLDQPDYLLLNTVCGLPTMFPPRQHVADVEGETFLAWVRRRAHAKRADESDEAGRNLPSRSSYLPRALFGAYLKACFEQIGRQAPSNVKIMTYACVAVALRRDEDGECVECSDGTRVRARFVVLTTGHTCNCTPADGAVHDPYGFLRNLGARALDANAGIGLAGFGLSSFDVLAGLTVGRGGTFFTGADGGLRYQRSGGEPLIYMFSRSGLPYLARPYRDCGMFRYDPLIFEASRMRAIRSTNGGGGLDFLSTLLPLLAIELRVARCRMKLQAAGRPVTDDEWAGLRAGDPPQIERWVVEAERAVGAFDVAGFLGVCDLALEGGAAEYQQRFVQLLEEDLRESRLGTERSERKYLAEVLLHLREGLNAAVDFGGLEVQSHDYFFGDFAGTVRRLAIGPQPERSEELIALIRAGVVKVELGPNPVVKRRPDGAFDLSSRNLARPASRVVSALIRAQSPFPSLEQADSSLLTDLAGSGRVRKYRDGVRFSGGVEVDRLHHPIGRSGQVETSLFVLGPLCEGSIYYNTYVPTTVGWSRPFIEAEIVVGQILLGTGLTTHGQARDEQAHGYDIQS